MSIRINRVYTRTGDLGETGLVGGQRTSKTDPRVEAYGDVDELNSVLGLAKEVLPAPLTALRAVLEYIQQELFDLGSELATPTGAEYQGMWKTGAVHVEMLEKLCDRFGDGLPELRSFILPGGSISASWFHVARTIARRAERRVITVRDILAAHQAGGESLNPYIVQYLNRLSDLLFILARWSLVQEGKEAPLWEQERSRSLPDKSS